MGSKTKAQFTFHLDSGKFKILFPQISATTTEYQCTTGASYPGTGRAVMMNTTSKGYATSSVSYEYELEVFAKTQGLFLYETLNLKPKP